MTTKHRRPASTRAASQARHARPCRAHRATGLVQVHFRVPADQEQRLPAAWAQLPHNAQLPRSGEVVTLSNRSTWAVTVVVHEWQQPAEPRVELCMEAIDGHLAGDAPPSAYTH